jgi:MYXO-CTERM domain-containing protein
LLWTFSGDVGDLPLNQHESFAPNVFSANGLRLQWRDSAFNVGLDNLDFSLERTVVNGVPEPEGALWWVGLAALGATWQRRRKA